MFRQEASVFLIAAGVAAGCAEHLGSTNRALSWSTGVLFWPPPRATTHWISEPAAPARLGDIAAVIENSLRRAGFVDQRWFPIGVHYEHGFAVTTRLERIGEDGSPKTSAERWMSQYPAAASLPWLGDSAEPYLPAPGRYRVLLIAFTDLHFHIPGRPPRLDESTAMDAPGFRAKTMPARRQVAAGYRVGVYVYEYEASSADGAGTFLPRDTSVPASAHVERSALSALKAIGGTFADE